MLSIDKDKTYLKIDCFGINLKRFFYKKIYETFLSKEVKPNTVLIIEINGCHHETIPGLCKYFLELGYNVDVLTREPAESIFDGLTLSNLRVYECNEKTFDKIYKNYDFSKYDRIIYNSKRVYLKNKKSPPEGLDIADGLGIQRQGKNKSIALQHHIDKYENTESDTQIILANPAHKTELNDFIVNSHYFKENSNVIRDKNNIVNFISIGEFSKNRRKNFSLLINAVDTLQKQGLSNFKITVIGRGKKKEIPFRLRKYFNILGRVDFQVMFNALEKSDFILTLLDPNIESHKRYMAGGTSGTFQLIYGFLKPCLIHKTFADIYDFTDKNSIVYEKNDDLAMSMKNAIELSQDEYNELQNNLNQKVKTIEEISKNNLKRILNI